MLGVGCNILTTRLVKIMQFLQCCPICNHFPLSSTIF
uniref:Uncharacterized protein n=1 Tax=Rhizophora mucronata TaxID=61149 RepID=A0A2P2PUC4_RHIMU